VVGLLVLFFFFFVVVVLLAIFILIGRFGFLVLLRRWSSALGSGRRG
jgi:hypothetical protein